MEKKELTELGVGNWDKLRRAIKEGNKDGALAFVDSIIADTQVIRDALAVWVNSLHNSLAVKLGDDAAYEEFEAYYKRFHIPHRPTEEQDLHGPAEARLRSAALGWTKWHALSVKIDEDKEKYILTIPCDTGGRLNPQEQCDKPKQAHPWTHGQQDVSFYCAHCAVAFEIMGIKRFGYPVNVVFPPTKAGEPCVWYLYKDIKDTPEKYYERVGLKKGKGK